MSAPYSLLPPNATDLERRTEAALRFDDVASAIDAVDGIKADLPAAFAPWLAAEWWLADFARYFDSTAELIAAGLPWLRMRGTAAAVKRALSWIGIAAVLEEDGARLHLDAGFPEAAGQIEDIPPLVGASIPAHVLFYRLYHGYDLRALRLDVSRLDDALLDDDSGADITGIKVSHGRRHGHLFAAASAAVTPYLGRGWRMRVRYDDSPRLDLWRLDSELVANPRFVVTPSWSGAWDARHWGTRLLPIYH